MKPKFFESPMSNTKNRLVIAGLICVIIIVFTYIGFWYSKNYPRKSDLAESTPSTEAFAECGYADDLRKVITDIQAPLYKEVLPIPNLYLLWKLSPNTPFVGLSASAHYNFAVNTTQKPEDLFLEFEQKLSSEGFLINKAGSFDVINTAIEKGRVIHLAFEKDGDIYLLRYDELSSEQYSNLPLCPIDFYCGKIDQNYTEVYKQLLPFAAQEQWDEKTTLQIWYDQSSVVVLSIGGIQMIGGHGSIWTNQNDRWEKIYEGQETPLCSVYEERNIGKGLPCIDEQTGVDRTANEEKSDLELKSRSSEYVYFPDFASSRLVEIKRDPSGDVVTRPPLEKVKVYLYAADETVSKVENVYCGAPVLGANLYRGHYQLILDASTLTSEDPGFQPHIKPKDSKIDIGEYEFVEGTYHDGQIVIDQLDPDGYKNFIIIYSYESCNSETIRVYGYDFYKDSLVLYKFRDKDGKVEDSTCVSTTANFPAKPLIKSKEGNLITRCYSQITGNYELNEWKFILDKDEFQEIKHSQESS